MKNCDPFVPGPAVVRQLRMRKAATVNTPALAIERVYGRSCLSLGEISSSNVPPQILSPPVPSCRRHQPGALVRLQRNRLLQKDRHLESSGGYLAD